MTKDKWGPEIPVTIIDCKRPDWLRDDQVCCLKIIRDGEYVWHGAGHNLPASFYSWRSRITAIKLLADDPYYQTLTPAEPEVTLEALEAAAKYAGYRHLKNNIQCVLENPEHYPMSHAIARLLMKHEPHRNVLSFDERTVFEFGIIQDDFENNLYGKSAIDRYRIFIKQHIKDAERR
jgi:hypothetical protein